MKSKANPFLRQALAAAITIGFAATSHAAEYTWDTSATAGIQAGNSVSGWGTDTFWTTDGGTTRVGWPGTSHTATFAGTAGTYTVQLSGNIGTAVGTSSLGGLNLATDGYTLQSNDGVAVRTITMGTSNAAGFITIGSGVTATIGNRVKVTKGSTNGQLDLYGGGTLVIGSGTAGGGASLDTTNGANASFINANTTMEVKTGGTAAYGTSLGLGNTVAGGGTVKITGGDLKIANTGSNLILQNASGTTAASTITISSGSIEFTNTGNTGGIRFGPSGGSSNPLSVLTGTLNLDGGIATINKIYMGGAYTSGAKYTAVVNLNGGTLKALTNQVDFFEGITNANNNSTTSGAFVKAGGAIFDTNGKDITVSQALIADSTSGGLEKKGSGTLTLDATSTYTGDTLVNGGTLTLASTGGLKFVIGADDVNNQISGTGAGTVNLGGLFTFDLTAASAILNDSWNIVDVGNLTESFGSTFSVAAFSREGGGTGAGIWTKAIGLTTFSYQFNTSNGMLTVIPEPNVAAMLGGIGMFCLLRRRRA